MSYKVYKRRFKCKGPSAVLILEDGTVFEGCGLGSPGLSIGELVFTTGMVGYPEAITDPSFRGQILVFTHPLIGNYGVPSKDIIEYGVPKYFESDKPQVRAVVTAYTTSPSHWTSIIDLEGWLMNEGIPGITMVDTRMIVKMLREKGVMNALVYTYEGDVDIDELMDKLRSSLRYDYINLVAEVMPKNTIFHEPPDVVSKASTVVLVDCGVKYGIIRALLKRGFRVIRIPCIEDPLKYVDEFGASGIVYSNGPGNPLLLKDTIEYARGVLEYGIPTLGICLGHQILAIASGAEIYKLKYGHRGQNKPCMDLERGKCFVTSQNHGYAVDNSSIADTGFKLWFINIDDKTVEGLKHNSKPVITVQFHPEASPGPHDSEWIFNLFRRLVEKYGVAN